MIREMHVDEHEGKVYVDTARAKGVLRALNGMERELGTFQVEHCVQLASQSEPWAAAAAVLASMSWAIAVEKGTSLSKDQYFQATMKYFLRALQDGLLTEMVESDQPAKDGNAAEPAQLLIVFQDDDGREFAVDDESFLALGLVVDIVHELQDVLELHGSELDAPISMCAAEDAAVLLSIISYKLSLDDDTAGPWSEHLAAGKAFFNRVLHRHAPLNVTTNAETSTRLRHYLQKHPDLDLRVMHIDAGDGIKAFVYPAITQQLLKVLSFINAEDQGWWDDDGVTGNDLAKLYCTAILWKASIGTAQLTGLGAPRDEEQQVQVRTTLEAALETEWGDDFLDKVLEAPTTSARTASSSLH